MPKQLFKGFFLYQREGCIRYAYAFSEKQARTVMIRRMAKETGVDPVIVFSYFKEHPDRATITIEMEVKENDGN
jgi:hypothetical protein